MPAIHSDLPIVTPDPPPPPRPASAKYGGLPLVMGIGLVVLIALLGWFGASAWSMREIWRNVYVLHNAKQPEEARIRAAFALSRDQRVTDRQLWDIALRRDLPPLARYLVAEALTASAIDPDPRAYALSVARSEDWPDWLRLLLARPLALAAGGGASIPREPIEELRSKPDPFLKLWAAYIRAASGDLDARAELQRAADTPNERQAVAEALFAALFAPDAKRRANNLDVATVSLRRHHPEAARLWAGWEARGDQLVRVSR